MRTACWIPKAINTRSEYVIFIAFPLQQWLHERSSLLPFAYIACHVSIVQDAGDTGLIYVLKSQTKTLLSSFRKVLD